MRIEFAYCSSLHTWCGTELLAFIISLTLSPSQSKFLIAPLGLHRLFQYL